MRRAFFFSTACLIGVGVFRPVLSATLRESWTFTLWSLAILAAAAGWAAYRRRERYLVAILPLTLALMYAQPQRVASDGIFYFAPLHSVIVDGDLDFENEYRVLGAREGYFVRTETGRLPNNYSIGPAILWSPFYLVAHGFAHLGLYRPTGFGYPYFTAIATGTAFAGFFGVWCVFRWVRKHFDSKLALATSVLIWLGTSHIWYMTFEPSMSHAMAMASAAWFLLLTGEGAVSDKEFAVMGAVGGLVALIRWQNVLFLPVALVVSVFRHGWPSPRKLAIGAFAFVLVFSPQLLYWKALYGTFLLVPQGGGYIDGSSPELGSVLFSSRHGLLSWAPVLWLSVLGVPGLVKRVPVLAISLLIATGAAWYVNASVYDWWGGASFGSRRFDAALPGFALAMAVSLGFMADKVRKRPLAAVFAGLAPLLAWNGMLMGVYFRGAIPPDGPASFKQAVSDGLDLFYPRVGYPPSWPASLLGDEPPGSFDLVGAKAPANNVFLRMGDLDALYLGTGWSLPERGRYRTTRSVRGGRAELIVTLREPADYRIELVGVPGGVLQLELNGAELASVRLDVDGRAVVSAPARLVSEGVNRLVFLVPRAESLSLASLSWIRSGD